MYQIRMEYNPYKQEISYQFLGSSGWQPLSPENKLANDKYQKTALQSSVDEILKQIIMQYATDAEHSVGIVFCGTDEDYADLTDAIQRNPKVINGAVKVVAEKDKESFYQPASVVAEKIDSIFSGLENEFSQIQDEEVKAILRQYDDASSSTIPLCVMGLYSSGKSMFINALIGEEILPSASDPLTAQIFKVTPGTNYQVAFSCENTELHFEIIEQTVRLINREDCSQCSAWIKAMTGITGTTNAEIMREIISKLNDSDKPSDKLKSEGLTPVSGLISIEVPFRNSALPIEKIHFEIYDTPGLNSESHNEHTKVLQAALEDRTNGLPILITTRDTLDLTGIQNLMDELNCKGVNLDCENLMILINQADRVGLNNLKQFHDTPPKVAVTIQKKSSILFLSSIMALGCKCKGLKHTVWVDGDCKEIYEDKLEKFSDPRNENCRVFPKYGILPPSRYEEICQQAEKAEDAVTSGDTSEDSIRELIAQNSGIRAVESEITYYAQRFAYYNKCRMAAEYLEQAIGIVENKVTVEAECTDAINAELNQKRDQVRKQLIRSLEEFTQRIVSAAENNVATYLVAQDRDMEKLKTQADMALLHLCEIHKKDKNYYQLQMEINSKFAEYANKYRKSISEISVRYWNGRAQELKEGMIQIVNGNQDISEEEQRILEMLILDYTAIRLPSISFDVRKKEGIIRDKRLFGLFKIGEKVNIAKCRAEFGNAFSNDCHDVVHAIKKSHKNTFEQWSENLNQVVIARLDEFNADLNMLNVKLQQSKERLKNLEHKKSHLADEKIRIQEMLNRQEELL